MVSANLALWFWWTLNTSSCHIASVWNCCFIAKLFCCKVSKNKLSVSENSNWCIEQTGTVQVHHFLSSVQILGCFSNCHVGGNVQLVSFENNILYVCLFSMITVVIYPSPFFFIKVMCKGQTGIPMKSKLKASIL